MKLFIIFIQIILTTLTAQAGFFDEPSLQDFIKDQQKYSQENLVQYLTIVNRNVNQEIRYTAEAPEQNQWQTPLISFTQKQGDCEDYAILKYFIIKQNLPHNIVLRLAFTQTLPDKIFHMVLLAKPINSSEFFVLDNLTHQITTLAERTDLSLLFSLDEEKQYKLDTNEVMESTRQSEKLRNILLNK
jgi:predicted transglutaminase-like cysteine proteinase